MWGEGDVAEVEEVLALEINYLGGRSARELLPFLSGLRESLLAAVYQPGAAADRGLALLRNIDALSRASNSVD